MNKKFDVAESILAALAAKDFVWRHGNSLSELLHALAGERGLDLFCEADRLLDGLSPDPIGVGKVLREMRDVLAELDAPDVQNAASLRWHGARLSDLVARLQG